MVQSLSTMGSLQKLVTFYDFLTYGHCENFLTRTVFYRYYKKQISHLSVFQYDFSYGYGGLQLSHISYTCKNHLHFFSKCSITFCSISPIDEPSFTGMEIPDASEVQSSSNA